MAAESFGSGQGEGTELESDAAAYQSGYERTMREYRWVRAHGWAPTERQIVRALTQTLRVYSAARGGKHVSGPRPDWLRGRADALRDLLRQQAESAYDVS
jgi:hypothetical protein